jgi:hypothetical protein
MLSANSNYGLMFADVLHRSIRNLTHGSWKRDRNPGAPFHFGENHLRKALRSHIHPVEWPPLVIERSVAGDLVEKDKQHGGVDLFFAPHGSEERCHLSDVLATCEVKGPTRRAFLGGSRRNWYPKIVADLRKQRWRAGTAPAGEHYLALMVQPRPGSATRAEFLRVITSILEEVPNTYLEETSWVEMPDVEQLNVIVLQVLPKHEP